MGEEKEEHWVPRTKEDWHEVFAGGIQLDRQRQEEADAKRAEEEEAKNKNEEDNDSDDKRPRTFAERLLGF